MADRDFHTEGDLVMSIARKLRDAEALATELGRTIKDLRAFMDDLNDAERWKLEIISLAVSEAFALAPAELHGANRQWRVARARHAFCHIAVTRSRRSLEVIGRYSGRHHTSIRNSIERAAGLLETDPDFAAEYKQAEAATERLWKTEAVPSGAGEDDGEGNH